MKIKLARLAALAAASVSASAFALPPDFTTLTAQIDMSTVSAALLLAAAALMGVAVIWKGAKMIVAAFKG